MERDDRSHVLREAVAANLRAYKGRGRLTDAQVAALVGMSRAAVQTRMSGATPCSLDDLERFAAAFGVEVGELLSIRWYRRNAGLMEVAA